ncbi:methyl-accepting chemotaxis protein [Oceanotoga teriensis]|uniref:methyl-accepting chemotaxis protein n=1 Tax=Oceanotoga teriensis TaxID=515440 RepID=UPI002712601B|nr:methyl-accepting chemotaxis protein [Oceanotoga teriensis]MDO7975931.1 methyl-accepting chemotaxis protein [Oceanotoga teriensis]
MKMGKKIIISNMILFISGFIIFFIIMQNQLKTEIERYNIQILKNSTDLKYEYFMDFFENLEQDLILLSKRQEIYKTLNMMNYNYQNNKIRYKEDFQKNLKNIYIEKNPFKEKEKMKSSFDIDEILPIETIQMIAEYDTLHEQIQKILYEIIIQKKYDDIKFISLDKDIIYTTKKDSDFAKSIKNENGPLNDLIKEISEDENNNIHITDFYEYNDKIVSFIGIKLTDEYSSSLGYLIIQINNKLIDEIMNSKQSNTETYIVGKDNLMRNQSIYTNKPTTLNQKIQTEQVKNALNNQQGNMISKNYLNQKVISTYKPFNYKEINWAIIGETSYQILDQQIQKLIKQFIPILIIIIIIITITGFIISKKNINPITKLKENIDKFSNGDLTQSFKQKGNYEINSISNSLNKMSKTLNQSINQIYQKSKKLEIISSKIKQSSQDIFDEYEKTKNSIENLDKDSQETTASIEEVSSSIQEMYSASNEIYENIKDINKNMENLNHISSDTQDNIEKIKNISQITKDQSSKNKKIALKIEDNIKQLEKILKVLDTISKNTDLLALNASIEAARAGEAGKGFAVVAQEVRTLSTENQKFNKQIEKIINQIKEDSKINLSESQKTNELIINTEEYTNNIKTTYKKMENKIEQTIEKTKKIEHYIKTLNTINGEIAESMTSATNAIDSISNKTNSIAQTLKLQNQKNTENKELSDQVKKLTDDLKSEFKKFIL